METESFTDSTERLSDEYHEDSLPDLVLDTCTSDIYLPSTSFDKEVIKIPIYLKVRLL